MERPSFDKLRKGFRLMNWIAEFIETAAAAKVCTRIHCTTCGALDFRRDLVRKANDALGISTSTWDDALAGVTAEGLAHLPDDFTRTHIEAIRLVFFELWSNLGDTAFKRRLLAGLSRELCRKWSTS